MNTNKKVQYQEFTKAKAGVQSEIPATSNVNIAGKAWTQAQLVQVFQTALSSIDSVIGARAQLVELILLQGTAIQAASQLYKELRKFAENEWGKGSPVLAAFGFKAAQPTQKSSATKAIAAAKSRQTRKVHGTLGKRQKKAQTVAGSAGLLLVGPDGKPLPGLTQGPVPPALPPGTADNSGK
ncbi:MAG: hypothetical protein ACYCWW_09520 [Deltaproteobacteria bacterium]